MKAVGLVLLWLVGSGTAVAVAWQGVNIVDNQVINPPHAALATPSNDRGAQVDSSRGSSDVAAGAPLGADDSATGADATVDSADSGSDASGAKSPDEVDEIETAPAPTSAAARPTQAPTSRPAPAPPPTSTPRLGGQSPKQTPQPLPTKVPSPTQDAPATATAEPSPTGSPSPSASPTVPDGPPETLRFLLLGGETEVYFSATSVEALWAIANPGYTVQIEQRGSDGVRVEFESEDGRSRVDASWDGSAQWDISES